MSFIRHRRFLPIHHSYRKQKMAFNGKDELDMTLELLSGEKILLKLNGKKFTMEQTKKKSKPTQKAGDFQNFQKVGYGQKSLKAVSTLDL